MRGVKEKGENIVCLEMRLTFMEKCHKNVNSFYNVNRTSVSVERGEGERGKYCCVCKNQESDSEKFKVCAGCLSTYCSKDCQRKEWAQHQSIRKTHNINQYVTPLRN